MKDPNEITLILALGVSQKAWLETQLSEIFLQGSEKTEGLLQYVCESERRLC